MPISAPILRVLKYCSRQLVYRNIRYSYGLHTYYIHAEYLQGSSTGNNKYYFPKFSNHPPFLSRLRSLVKNQSSPPRLYHRNFGSFSELKTNFIRVFKIPLVLKIRSKNDIISWPFLLGNFKRFLYYTLPKNISDSKTLNVYRRAFKDWEMFLH